MRKRVFVSAILLVGLLVCSSTLPRDRNAARAAPRFVVGADFDTDHWEIKDAKTKKEEFRGRPSLFLADNDLAYSTTTRAASVQSPSVAPPGVLTRWELSEAFDSENRWGQ